MRFQKLLIPFAVVMFLYAAVLIVIDARERQLRPDGFREVSASAGPISFGEKVVRFEESSLVKDDSLSRGIVSLVLETADTSEKLGVSKNVWIDMQADRNNYQDRYLGRYETGFLHRKDARDLYVIETLQGDSTLADDPLLNIWIIGQDSDPVVRTAISRHEAGQHTDTRSLFAQTHGARAHAFPALAAILTGLAALLAGLSPFWRQGGWGLLCALICFLVPVVGGAPLIASVGWRLFIPAIVIAFLITAYISSSLSRRLKRQPGHNLLSRFLTAAVVPVVTLVVGLVCVVSLTSVSVLPVKGLGFARPGELFWNTVTYPSWLLLKSGAAAAGVMAACKLMVDFVRHGR